MRGFSERRMRRSEAAPHVALPGPHMCGPPVGACADRNTMQAEGLKNDPSVPKLSVPNVFLFNSV